MSAPETGARAITPSADEVIIEEVLALAHGAARYAQHAALSIDTEARAAIAAIVDALELAGVLPAA